MKLGFILLLVLWIIPVITFFSINPEPKQKKLLNNFEEQEKRISNVFDSLELIKVKGMPCLIAFNGIGDVASLDCDWERLEL